MALLAAIAYPGIKSFWSPTAVKDLTLTGVVTRSHFKVLVTDRGNLEACKTEDGVCEVSGRENKIVMLVPEGTHVKKGQVVCRFDTAEIDKSIAQQEIQVKQAETKIETTAQELEIQKNKGESEITDAELELKLADLDAVKYQKGDYEVEIKDVQGAIALAEVELQKAKEMFEQFRTLVKKGFKTPEQLREKEQDVRRTENYLERDRHKLYVKKEFEYRRKTTELESKLKQAYKKVDRSKASSKAGFAKSNSEYVSAKSTHALEKQRLDEYKKQKQQCVLLAKQDGVLAYANEEWYDSSRQIREGAMVYFRQKIFSLPDLSKMQVKVSVHESIVKKVKPGQKVDIKVDAFANTPIVGTVKSVSPLADSTRWWMNGGAKEYATIVEIDKMPSEDIKPGMTSEVSILVNELTDVLAVPVQAVTERRREKYAYVQVGDKFERRTVKVGDTNDKLVQILEGLSEGEAVALDARKRGLADKELEDDKDEAKAKPATAGKSAAPR